MTTTTTIEGLDVSSHNPVSLPRWGEVAFGMVRATHGLGQDAQAHEHLARAHGAGVDCLGTYHFLRGDRPGTSQAEVFWERTAQLERGLVPLALAVDVEDLPPPAQPWDLVTYGRVLTAFVERLRVLAPGRPCAVYGSPSYLASLAVEKGAAGPLWVAHWSAAKPQIPPPWSTWALWQYAVTGGLDRNLFNGSRAEWGHVFGLLPPAPVVPSQVDVGAAELADRIRQATGRGRGAEDFMTWEEGPVIDGG